MSLWAFKAAIGGFVKANSGEDDDMTREDVEAISALMDRAVKRSGGTDG